LAIPILHHTSNPCDRLLAAQLGADEHNIKSVWGMLCNLAALYLVRLNGRASSDTHSQTEVYRYRTAIHCLRTYKYMSHATSTHKD
jgi:hypothetical protein